MNYKQLTILLAFLLICSNAFAPAPDVNVLNRDVNYYYPNRASTITIEWRVIDADEPNDVNIGIYYMDDPAGARIAIVDTNGASGVDSNSMQFCAAPLSATDQVCSFDWPTPSGLDQNMIFDVNVFDITTGDDLNDSSKGSVYVDFNACTTTDTVTGDDINFNLPVCTGYGIDSPTIYYSKSRQGRCADNYTQYQWVPFSLTFGEFTICYYSVDSVGNTEITSGLIHTADSDAMNVALLVELILAAIVIALILGFIVNRELSPEIMIGLTLAAIIIAICIYIFGTIL